MISKRGGFGARCRVGGGGQLACRDPIHRICGTGLWHRCRAVARRAVWPASRRDWRLARIAEKPDLTLRGLRAELAANGIKVSHGALWAFLAREGITFKKRACTPANRTAPTSPAGASDGRNTRAGLAPNAWSSSTRPGPR